MKTNVRMETTNKIGARELAVAALFAALSYIGFQVFRFDIPVGTEKTAFHLGNTFVALSALLLGGPLGGLSGALGLTIADLTSGYATSAPKTFVLKLVIGLIVGFVAHNIFEINTVKDKKKIVYFTIISTCSGLFFNVVADPVVGFFYKKFILGLPHSISETFAKMSAVTTSVNAVISIMCATILYLALRPVLSKIGVLEKK